MKLIKNYMYNLVYQVFILIVPLITVPYISRVLGANGVGVNAYTNSIVSYFIIVGNLGVLTYGNRTIAYLREDKEKTSKAFWEINLMRLTIVTLSIIVYLIYSFYSGNMRFALLAQFPLLLACIFDISWFFMGIEDFEKTVIRNVIVKIISLLLIFTLVKTENDILIYILILSLSQLIGNILLWPYMKKYLVPVKFKKLNIGHHFWPSINLFIPQIAIQVYVVVSRTMLGNISGNVATGYFDNADKIVRVLLAVVTATGVVLLPRMANEFAKGRIEVVEKLVNFSLNFASLIAFPLTFGLIAIAPEFSALFFGSNFTGIESILSLLAIVIIAISWSNVIGQQYLLPLNDMNGYTGAVFLGAVSNIVLNLFLIPRYAALGAAISAMISEILVTLYQLFYVRHRLHLKSIFADVWKYLVASIVMMFVVMMIKFNTAGWLTLLLRVSIGGVVYLSIIVLLNPQIVVFLKEKAMGFIKAKGRKE